MPAYVRRVECFRANGIVSNAASQAVSQDQDYRFLCSATNNTLQDGIFCS